MCCHSAQWKFFELKVDPDMIKFTTLVFKVYDYDKIGKHDFIGEARSIVAELLAQKPLTLRDKQKETGELLIQRARLTRKYRFLKLRVC